MYDHMEHPVALMGSLVLMKRFYNGWVGAVGPLQMNIVHMDD